MSKTSNFVQNIIELGTVTILNGEATSTALDNVGTSASAVILPAAMTSVSCTFLVSADNVSAASAVFHPLIEATGALIIQTFTPGQAFTLSPPFFWQWRYIKFVVNVNEAADRILTVVRRSL